jgi:cob(I)alamin adenosyltransferase
MRIYTRTGDGGETGLLGGIRVPKDHLRVAAYGEIDELNAQIGLLRAAINEPTVRGTLETIQNFLFEAGAELAAPPETPSRLGAIYDGDVTFLEGAIDQIEAALPQRNQFILPGGTEAAGRAHLARCVCRRAERAAVHLLRAEPIETHVLAFLNRLSDYLFVLARWANLNDGVADLIWRGRGKPPAEMNMGGPTPGS